MMTTEFDIEHDAGIESNLDINLSPDFEKTEEITYDENILNFLDYIILLLSQANTAEEVDLIMDDFMSDDVKTVIKENNVLFSNLSVIWLNAFERIFMDYSHTDFPLKVLSLPILFREFNWKIEDKSKLSNLHIQALDAASNSTNLYPYLVLLFLEGNILQTEIALNNFENRVKLLSSTEDDNNNLKQIIEDVASLQWKN